MLHTAAMACLLVVCVPGVWPAPGLAAILIALHVE